MYTINIPFIAPYPGAGYGVSVRRALDLAELQGDGSFATPKAGQAAPSYIMPISPVYPGDSELIATPAATTWQDGTHSMFLHLLSGSNPKLTQYDFVMCANKVDTPMPAGATFSISQVPASPTSPTTAS